MGRVQLSAGQDVNDVAVGAKNPTDVLDRTIRQASWMGKGTALTPRRQVLSPEPPLRFSSAAAVDLDGTLASDPAPAYEPSAELCAAAGGADPGLGGLTASAVTDEDTPLVSER